MYRQIKVIIFSLFAIALLVSCKNKAEFTISGTIKNGILADYTEIYLVKANYDYMMGETLVDTAVVVNGAFQFKGTIVEPEVRFIDVHQESGICVLLEPGVINIVVDILSTTGGTPSNEKYNTFNIGLNEQKKVYDDLYSRLMSATNEAEKEKLTRETSNVDEEFKTSRFSFVKENATNQLGICYFAKNFPRFNLDQLKEGLSLIPDKFKDNERYRRIEENVASQEMTKVGSTYTDIKGFTPNGKEIALSDYVGKGKVVLVHFWGSWSPPSRIDISRLVAAYAKYKDQGLEIVGVNVGDNQGDWGKEIKDLGITWPQLSDFKGMESEPTKIYAISAIPNSVVIDKDGIIIARNIGGAALYAQLGEILDK